MNNLLNLQKAFQARLLNNKNSSFQQMVVSTQKPSTKERINIYAEGYRARLLDALRDNYSQLAQYMGQKAFGLVAKAYLAKYPSNFRLIQLFGDKLANFLQEHYPKKPVFAELAKFELAIGHTFDVKDQITATVESLKKIQAPLWPKMQFVFHPSVSIHNFNYNIIELWNGLLKQDIKKPVKLKHIQTIVFWRHKLETLYRPIIDAETEVITIAINGGTFAETCNVLGKNTDESTAAAKAVSLLIQWLNAGLISQISTL